MSSVSPPPRHLPRHLSHSRGYLERVDLLSSERLEAGSRSRCPGLSGKEKLMVCAGSLRRELAGDVLASGEDCER